MPESDSEAPESIDLSALATPSADIEERIVRRVMASLAERDRSFLAAALSIARPAIVTAAVAAVTATFVLWRDQAAPALPQSSVADLATALGVAGPFARALADGAAHPWASDLLVTYRGR